jgi:hypothetical protein
MRRIAATACAPHSSSTNGATLRPVPCSAFSEPSYFPTDHRAHLVHEAAVALDLGCVAEVLREDEVEIALERVAEDDRLVVAVLVEQLLQVERRFGEPFDRERDVLR